MANPFTAFAFPASGAGVTTNITLPTRLAYIENVKDCGAKGDGVTDDLPAITTALNVVAGRNKGTIYFPPGTYYVSAPISYAASQGGVNSVHWLGEPGLSIVTGNFSDFIFKYNGGDQFNIWEKLTISNTNATGGGIAISSDSNNQAIRNCTFICNQGISGAGVGGGTALDGSVENCTFSPPVGGVTNSYGAGIPWNGPIAGCTFTGLDYGLLIFGQEGAMEIVGCRFEQCGVGFAPGILTDLTTIDEGANFLLAGCYFKNCGTGINFHGGSSGATIAGIRIEGTNGQARGGLNPQYGIFSDRGQPGSSILSGVIVTGQYDVAAVHLGTGANFASCNFMGISAANSGSGAVWDLPSPITVLLPTFSGCNKSVSYPVATLPGSPNEGDEYNVSDGTNSLAWGATVTNTGTHTTHYLVRYNGSNFTVMGQ